MRMESVCLPYVTGSHVPQWLEALTGLWGCGTPTSPTVPPARWRVTPRLSLIFLSTANSTRSSASPKTRWNSVIPLMRHMREDQSDDQDSKGSLILKSYSVKSCQIILWVLDSATVKIINFGFIRQYLIDNQIRHTDLYVYGVLVFVPRMSACGTCRTVPACRTSTLETCPWADSPSSASITTRTPTH